MALFLLLKYSLFVPQQVLFEIPLQSLLVYIVPKKSLQPWELFYLLLKFQVQK